VCISGSVHGEISINHRVDNPGACLIVTRLGAMPDNGWKGKVLGDPIGLLSNQFTQAFTEVKTAR
jgi:hypothetical protein